MREHHLHKNLHGGHGIAAFILGGLYAVGRGVPKDLALARMWTGVVAGKGDDAAKKQLFQLERDLSPDQIADAGRRGLEIAERLVKSKK